MPKISWLAILLVTLSAGCSSSSRVAPFAGAPAGDGPPAVCADPANPPNATPGAALVKPADPLCANPELTAYDGLLVLAPHPDDETLGFAGLAAAYRALGKPVAVVVTTDGDAYCEACRFWKTSLVTGVTCDAADLSNFATPAIDSFGEVRRGESRAAAAIQGLEAPGFLGYPDTGLAAAWKNFQAGEMGKPLRRSDFSRCASCESCEGGYGEGPETTLSAATLMAALGERLAAVPARTLVATTHPLDGHADHSALGNFVRLLNDKLATPHPIAFAVIHAHTRKTTAHPDCWYPAPQAIACPCMNGDCANADATWVRTLQRHRFRPDWPAALPDDADYGRERQLCLPGEMVEGEQATKLRAVRAYGSQLGTSARAGAHPEALNGILDCNGYLISFVRRSEAFVLVDPAP